MDYCEQAKLFKALSDEKRLLIMEQLRNGEKCACVLMEKLDVAQSALSYHMKILVESKLVVSRQDGKWVHYSIASNAFALANQWLQEITRVNPVVHPECCD